MATSCNIDNRRNQNALSRIRTLIRRNDKDYKAIDLYKDYFNSLLYDFGFDNDITAVTSNILRLLAALPTQVQVLASKDNNVRDFYNKPDNRELFEKYSFNNGAGYKTMRNLASFILHDIQPDMQLQNPSFYLGFYNQQQNQALEREIAIMDRTEENKRRNILKKFENFKVGDLVFFREKRGGKIEKLHGRLVSWSSTSEEAIVRVGDEDHAVKVGWVDAKMNIDEIPCFEDYAVAVYTKAKETDKTVRESELKDMTAEEVDVPTTKNVKLEQIEEFLRGDDHPIKLNAEYVKEKFDGKIPNPLKNITSDDGTERDFLKVFDSLIDSKSVSRTHDEKIYEKNREEFSEIVEKDIDSFATWKDFYRLKDVNEKAKKSPDKTIMELEDSRKWPLFSAYIPLFWTYVSAREKIEARNTFNERYAAAVASYKENNHREPKANEKKEIKARIKDELERDLDLIYEYQVENHNGQTEKKIAKFSNSIVKYAHDFDGILQYAKIERDTLEKKGHQYAKAGVHNPGDFVTQIKECNDNGSIDPKIQYIAKGLRLLYKKGDLSKYKVRVYSTANYYVPQNRLKGNKSQLPQGLYDIYDKAYDLYATDTQENHGITAFALICDENNKPLKINQEGQEDPEGDYFIVDVQGNKVLKNTQIFNKYLARFLQEGGTEDEFREKLAQREYVYFNPAFNRTDPNKYQLFTIKSIDKGSMFFSGDWNKQIDLNKITDIYGDDIVTPYVHDNKYLRGVLPNEDYKYPMATGFNVLLEGDYYHVNLPAIIDLNVNGNRGENVVQGIISALLGDDKNQTFVINGTQLKGEKKLEKLQDCLNTFLYINSSNNPKARNYGQNFVNQQTPQERAVEQSYLNLRMTRVDDDFKFILQIRTETNGEYKTFAYDGYWKDTYVDDQGALHMVKDNERDTRDVNKDIRNLLEKFFRAERNEDTPKNYTLGTYKIAKLNSDFIQYANDADCLFPVAFSSDKNKTEVRIERVNYRQLVKNQSKVLLNVDNLQEGVGIVTRNPYIVLEPSSELHKQFEDNLHASFKRKIIGLFSNGRSSINRHVELLRKNEETANNIIRQYNLDGKDFDFLFNDSSTDIPLKNDPLGDTPIDPSDLPFSIGHRGFTTKEQKKRAEEWFKNSPLAEHVKLNRLQHILNEYGVASFARNAINLYKGSDETELYHEAWHEFSYMFLSSEDRKRLMDEMKQYQGTFINHAGEEVKFSEASFDDIDEFLADNFREYAVNGGELTKRQQKLGFLDKAKRFFRKIYKGLRAIYNSIFGNKEVSEEVIDYVKNNPLQNEFVKELYDNLYRYKLDQYSYGTDTYDKAVAYSIRSMKKNNAATIVDSDSLVWVHPGMGLPEFMFEDEGVGSVKKKLDEKGNMDSYLKPDKRTIVDFSVEYNGEQSQKSFEKNFKDFVKSMKKANKYADEHNLKRPIFVIGDPRVLQDQELKKYVDKYFTIPKNIFVSNVVANGMDYDSAVWEKIRIDNVISKSFEKDSVSPIETTVSFSEIMDRSMLKENERHLTEDFTAVETNAAIRMMDKLSVEFVDTWNSRNQSSRSDNATNMRLRQQSLDIKKDIAKNSKLTRKNIQDAIDYIVTTGFIYSRLGMASITETKAENFARRNARSLIIRLNDIAKEKSEGEAQDVITLDEKGEEKAETLIRDYIINNKIHINNDNVSRIFSLINNDDVTTNADMYDFIKVRLQDEYKKLKSQFEKDKSKLTVSEIKRMNLIHKMLLNYGSPFNFNSNGEGVVYQHKLNSAIFQKDASLYEMDEENLMKLADGENYSNSDNDKSFIDTMNADIRLLLTTLPQSKNKYKRKDVYGTPYFESFPAVVNVLGRELFAPISDVELTDAQIQENDTVRYFEMVLDNDEKVRVNLNDRFGIMLYNMNRISSQYPFVKTLMTRLGSPFSNDIDTQMRWTHFYQTFDKAIVPPVFVIAGVDENGKDYRRVGTPFGQNQVMIGQWIQDLDSKFLQSITVRSSDKKDYASLYKLGGDEYSSMVLDMDLIAERYVGSNVQSDKLFVLSNDRLSMKLTGYRMITKDNNNKVQDTGITDHGVNEVFSFLSGIGMVIDDSLKQELKKDWLKDQGGGRSYYTALMNIANAIIKDGCTSIGELLKKERASVNIFASLAMKAAYIGNNFQYMRADGSFGYENQLHNEYTLITEALNNCNTYQDLLNDPTISWMDIRKFVKDIHGKVVLNDSYNPSIAGSNLLQRMFDFSDYQTDAAGGAIIIKNPYEIKRRTVNLNSENTTKEKRFVTANLRMISGTVILSKNGERIEGEVRYGSDKYLHLLETIALAKDGVFEITRAAESPSCYTFKIDDKQNFDYLYIPMQDAVDFSNIKFNNSIKDKEEEWLKSGLIRNMLPYIERKIQAELDRRLLCKSRTFTPESVEDWNFINKGMKWDVCVGIVGQKVLDKILSDKALSKMSNQEVLDLMKTDDYLLKGNVSKLIKDQEQEIKKSLVDYVNKLYEDALGSAGDIVYTEAELLCAVVNSTLVNLENWEIFFGDISQYKLDDTNKRNKGANGTGEIFRTDDVIVDYINKTLGATNYQSHMKQRVKDNNLSPTEEKFSKLFLGEGSTMFEYGKVLDTATLDELVYHSIYTEAFKNYVSSDSLKEYKKMKVCDGQGFITFDAYRALKFSQGKWSPEQEELFQKICKGEDISPADAMKFFPAMKAQYFGANMNQGSVDSKKFHKYSLYPIIPSMVRGTILEAIHFKLMGEGKAYVTFESAKKVGMSRRPVLQGDKIATDSDGNLLSTCDKIFIEEQGKNPHILNEDFYNPNWKFTSDKIATAFLKDQVYIHEEAKETVLYPTQLRSLLSLPFFSGNRPIDYKGQKKWSKLTEKEKIAKSPIYKKIVRYENAVKSYMDVEKQRLFKELGINENGITDIKPLMTIVDRELRKNGVLEENIAFTIKKFENLKSVQFNDIEDGGNSPKMDISSCVTYEEIEKVIMSIINRRLVRQNMKGDTYVQVANALFQQLKTEQDDEGRGFTNPTIEDINKYGSDDLPFYRRDISPNSLTKPMKVKVALAGQFVNLLNIKVDGKPIKVLNEDGTIDYAQSIERLNEILKDENAIDTLGIRDAITMIGVRIPVQGPNSTECMEVYQFLPPEAGNIIIPPAEIVAKTGSDFDIDKMYIMTTDFGVYSGKVELSSRFDKDGRVKTNDDIQAEVTEKELNFGYAEDQLYAVFNTYGISNIDQAYSELSELWEKGREAYEQRDDLYNKAKALRKEEKQTARDLKDQWLTEFKFGVNELKEIKDSPSLDKKAVNEIIEKYKLIDQYKGEKKSLVSQLKESYKEIKQLKAEVKIASKGEKGKLRKKLRELQDSSNAMQTQVSDLDTKISGLFKDLKETESLKKAWQKAYGIYRKQKEDDIYKTSTQESASIFEQVNQLKALSQKDSKKFREIKTALDLYHQTKDDLARTKASLRTASIGNEILLSVRDIILDKNYFQALITPNSTNLFKTKHDENLKQSYVEYYRDMNDKHTYPELWLMKAVVSYMMHDESKYLSNFVGKKTLGIIAVENVSFANLLRHGYKMTINVDSVFYRRLKELGANIEDNKDGKTAYLKFDERYLKNIKSSEERSAEIQEYISQLINGAVDVAKDDWIFFLGISEKNVSKFTFLIMCGVSPKTALDTLQVDFVTDERNSGFLEEFGSAVDYITQLKLNTKVDTERDTDILSVLEKRLIEARVVKDDGTRGEEEMDSIMKLYYDSVRAPFNTRDLKVNLVKKMTGDKIADLTTYCNINYVTRKVLKYGESVGIENAEKNNKRLVRALNDLYIQRYDLETQKAYLQSLEGQQQLAEHEKNLQDSRVIYEPSSNQVDYVRTCKIEKTISTQNEVSKISAYQTDVDVLIDNAFPDKEYNAMMKNVFFMQRAELRQKYNMQFAEPTVLYQSILNEMIKENSSKFNVTAYRKGLKDNHVSAVIDALKECAYEEYLTRRTLNKIPYGNISLRGRFSYATQWEMILAKLKNIEKQGAFFVDQPILLGLVAKNVGGVTKFMFNAVDEFSPQDIKENIDAFRDKELVKDAIRPMHVTDEGDLVPSTLSENSAKGFERFAEEISDYFKDMYINLYYQSPYSSIDGKFNFTKILSDKYMSEKAAKGEKYFTAEERVAKMMYLVDVINGESQMNPVLEFSPSDNTVSHEMRHTNSGGANGSDNYFRICKQHSSFKNEEDYHYYVKERNYNTCPFANVILDPSTLEEASAWFENHKHYKQKEGDKVYDDKTKIRDVRILRNYAQVLYSHTVVAVGYLCDNGEPVSSFRLPRGRNIDIDSTKTINIFHGSGENPELSNFYYRPFIISDDNSEVPVKGSFANVEAAFQAQKLHYSTMPQEEKDKLLQEFQDKDITGGAARSKRKNIKDLDTTTWDNNSSRIMGELLYQSFLQNENARKKLLSTGNAQLTHNSSYPADKWTKEFPRLLMEVRDKLSVQNTQTGASNKDHRVSDGQNVRGGTGWAVGQAKALGKTIYVYQQDDVIKFKKGWYKYNYGTQKFEKIENESDFPRYANMGEGGIATIGTRQLNENGKRAIEQFYEIPEEEKPKITDEYNEYYSQEINPFIHMIEAISSSDVTQSNNVVIEENLVGVKKNQAVDEIYDRHKVTTSDGSEVPGSVIAVRANAKDYRSLLDQIKQKGFMGNPFNWTKIGQVKAGVEFYEWLTKGGLTIGKGKSHKLSTNRVKIVSKDDVAKLFRIHGGSVVIGGIEFDSAEQFEKEYGYDMENLRKAYLRQIARLKRLREKTGKDIPVYYYKELGFPSHATILDKMINGDMPIESIIDLEEDLSNAVIKDIARENSNALTPDPNKQDQLTVAMQYQRAEDEEALRLYENGIDFYKNLKDVQSVFTSDEIAQIKQALNGQRMNVRSYSRTGDPAFFSDDVVNEIKEQKNIPFTDPRRINIIELWSHHDGQPIQDILRACKENKVACMTSFSITTLGGTPWEQNVLQYQDMLTRIQRLIDNGDLEPRTTTIRIDPLVPGVTRMSDVRKVIETCKQMGIRKFVVSGMQSYGYTEGREGFDDNNFTRDRGIIREGKKIGYDFDKYYGIVTKEDVETSKLFKLRYMKETNNTNPTTEELSLAAAINTHAESNGRLCDRYVFGTVGKYHHEPKRARLDENGSIQKIMFDADGVEMTEELLKIRDQYKDITLQTCSFYIPGLATSACLDPFVMSRITGIPVFEHKSKVPSLARKKNRLVRSSQVINNEFFGEGAKLDDSVNGKFAYAKSIERDQCNCWGLHSELPGFQNRICYSMCKFCYAGNNDAVIKARNGDFKPDQSLYYNNNGEIRNNKFANIWDKEGNKVYLAHVVETKTIDKNDVLESKNECKSGKQFKLDL